MIEEKESLPDYFIQDILIGLDELKSGQIEPYVFYDNEEPSDAIF